MSSPTQTDRVDTVDSNDCVIGTAFRSTVLEKGLGFRVAHVLVYRADGRIVLQRVGTGGTRSPGRWGSSVAGYLHAGEAPLAGAIRRGREEIGLTSPLHFAGRTRMLDKRSWKFIYVYVTHCPQALHILDSRHIAELREWSQIEITDALKERPNVFTATFPAVYEIARIHGD